MESLIRNELMEGAHEKFKNILKCMEVTCEGNEQSLLDKKINTYYKFKMIFDSQHFAENHSHDLVPMRGNSIFTKTRQQSYVNTDLDKSKQSQWQMQHPTNESID